MKNNLNKVLFLLLACVSMILSIRSAQNPYYESSLATVSKMCALSSTRSGVKAKGGAGVRDLGMPPDVGRC